MADRANLSFVNKQPMETSTLATQPTLGQLIESLDPSVSQLLMELKPIHRINTLRCKEELAREG